jgi:hypothetical protein
LWLEYILSPQSGDRITALQNNTIAKDFNLSQFLISFLKLVVIYIPQSGGDATALQSMRFYGVRWQSCVSNGDSALCLWKTINLKYPTFPLISRNFFLSSVPSSVFLCVLCG